MADYHPLDVRYRGPSTAYRGSRKLPRTPLDATTAPPAPTRGYQMPKIARAKPAPVAPQNTILHRFGRWALSSILWRIVFIIGTYLLIWAVSLLA